MGGVDGFTVVGAGACGPLARYASGYGLWFSDRGYSRWTIAHRLWQLDLLSRWLEREALSPDELTRERVVEFLAARRAGGYSTWLSVRSTALPLEYLRELGAVPAAAAIVAARSSNSITSTSVRTCSSPRSRAA